MYSLLKTMDETRELLNVIREEGIDRICEIIAREWPISVYVHEFIKTTTKWSKNDKTFDVNHYWFGENVESGIYVGVSRTGKTGLFLYASQGFERLFKHVLRSTKRIPWNEHPLLQGILPRHAEIIENVIREKNLRPKLYCNSTIQFLDRQKISNYDINCPPDVYHAKLTSKEVNHIYHNWPHRDIYTLDDIRYPIEQSVSLGIFSKDRNELLAWVMQAHYGAIGMLFTKEKARGRGYAKILVKLMIQELNKLSIQPYAAIMESNTKSIRLFHSVGFEYISPIKYIMVTKK